MRVRVNFTLDLEVQDYNERTNQELNKVQVREQIQERCLEYIMTDLERQGIDVELLGRNNVYDPKQRLTVAEHLVQGA